MAHKLDVVLMWHMHQPDYRDYLSGEFTQPWVYLHAMKDYTDMAAHLERHPKMRAVINLVPILLDQLEDYTAQFSTGPIRDPLLRLLARSDDTPLTEAERELVIQRCFNANHEKMMRPFPAYQRLYDLWTSLEQRTPKASRYLSDAYYYEVLVWYHLVWTGETVRRESELVARLIAQGVGFDFEVRQKLYALIGQCVSSVIPRYAALAKAGQIELSATPHYHPLAPLMINFASAREARPTLPLPAADHYPGGETRVRFHIAEALSSHARRFGVKPTGVWPAEGGVSTAFLHLLGEMGCRWAATGEGVLANSLREKGEPPPDKHRWLYRPWRLRSGGPVLFFRDDRLSDLIGFEYAKWHSRDAALNFMAELETLAQAGADQDAPLLASVILDGENCWEYYPYNGFYFLEALYTALEQHAYIHTTTFENVLSDAARVPAPLDKLVAGSWVRADFTTWIGSKDKNDAWDLLAVAKQAFDLVCASGRLNAEEIAAAGRQLASCESSDWFWWLGDYNPAQAVSSFDALYRADLARLYRLLKLPEPPALQHSLSAGGSEHPEAGGAMQRAG